jgi:uncharacterized membrane protein
MRSLTFSSRNLVVAFIILNLLATAIAVAIALDVRRDADARLDRTEASVRFLATQEARLRAARRNTAQRLLDVENRITVVESTAELLDSQVETFKEDSTARGNAVQFKAWSDLCFNVHDMGGLVPEDVEELRQNIIRGCNPILGRG